MDKTQLEREALENKMFGQKQKLNKGNIITWTSRCKIENTQFQYQLGCSYETLRVRTTENCSFISLFWRLFASYLYCIYLLGLVSIQIF